jgi:alkanesulfonate monooxygenase SsuD/methylene tetrahydromethanopterin reductase-like flavin-dependent oxidoreductase (luciferase family)
VLHATVDRIPLIDEASGGSEGQLVELLEAVRARASAAGNSVKVSATLTAVVVGSGAGKATRGRLAAQYKTTEALLARDLLYVVGEQQELLEKIAVLAQLGVDRVHVIPGPVDQPRTAAALREMLSAIHEVRA